MGRVQGKVAVVTGAARGMGAEHAKILAREGASVLVTDVLDELGRELVDGLKSQDYNVEYMHLDVSEASEWAEAISRVETTFGPVDILVNNAGVSSRAGLLGTEDSGWERVVAVNQTGVFYGMRAAVPSMLESGGGSIINITSVFGGVSGQADYFGYVATKAAVVAMTQSVALSHGKDGIRANAVAPGAIDTPMARSELEYLGIEMAEAAARLPIPRYAAPHEVSTTILFLASEESAYITGTVVPVDGGYTAGGLVAESHHG